MFQYGDKLCSCRCPPKSTDDEVSSSCDDQEVKKANKVLTKSVPEKRKSTSILENFVRVEPTQQDEVSTSEDVTLIPTKKVSSKLSRSKDESSDGEIEKASPVKSKSNNAKDDAIKENIPVISNINKPKSSKKRKLSPTVKPAESNKKTCETGSNLLFSFINSAKKADPNVEKSKDVGNDIPVQSIDDKSSKDDDEDNEINSLESSEKSDIDESSSPVDEAKQESPIDLEKKKRIAETIENVVDNKKRKPDNDNATTSEEDSDPTTSQTPVTESLKPSSDSITVSTPGKDSLEVSSKPSAFKTPGKSNLKPKIILKKITPKSLKAEAERKRKEEENLQKLAEKERLKKEKEEEKLKKLEEKEKLKKEKEEELNKLKEEKLLKKQLETDAKNKEKEEKRLKLEEERLKKKAKEDEKNKKEEEKRKQEEEIQNKKKKVAEKFTSFFVANKVDQKKSVEVEVKTTVGPFPLMQVGKFTVVAPTCRIELDETRRNSLDSVFSSTKKHTSETYLTKLKSKDYKPGKQRATPPPVASKSNENDDPDDCVVVGKSLFSQG